MSGPTREAGDAGPEAGDADPGGREAGDAGAAPSGAGRDPPATARWPRAALTFYWPLHGRQVRVRGTVAAESAERSAADLLARSPSARAEVLLGRQSSHLDSTEERDRAFRTALSRIESDPALVSPEWTLPTLVPVEVEFWQADMDRLHTRLRYERQDRHRPWERRLLWP